MWIVVVLPAPLSPSSIDDRPARHREIQPRSRQRAAVSTVPIDECESWKRSDYGMKTARIEKNGHNEQETVSNGPASRMRPISSRQPMYELLRCRALLSSRIRSAFQNISPVTNAPRPACVFSTPPCTSSGIRLATALGFTTTLRQLTNAR